MEADAILQEAESEFDKGNYEGAERLFQRFCDEGGEKPLAYLGIGKCQLRLGRSNEALASVKVALTSAEAQFGSISFPYAACLGDLCEVHVERAEFPEALRCSLKSAALIKLLHGEDSSTYGAALRIVGGVYFSKQEFALALKFYKSAEKLIDPVSMTFVKLLNDISAAHQELGNLARAMAVRQRAANLYARQADTDSFTKATMDFNLGRLHYLMRGFAKSETLFREAFKTFEENLGRDHPQTLEVDVWWQKAEAAAATCSFDECDISDKRCCENCGLIEPNMLMCSKCMQVYYCGPGCQKVRQSLSSSFSVWCCFYSSKRRSIGLRFIATNAKPRNSCLFSLKGLGHVNSDFMIEKCLPSR